MIQPARSVRYAQSHSDMIRGKLVRAEKELVDAKRVKATT